MKRRYCGIFRKAISTALLCALLGPQVATAATVRQVDFQELVGGSELVFHGRVNSVQSRWDSSARTVFTDVEFTVFDVLAGKASDNSTLRLSFPAGRHGDIEVVIHGLRIPELGEQGVYFVESTKVPMVNPIYGWSQGRFRVEAVDGSPLLRVFAFDGSPVLSVSAETGPASEIVTSRGTARGVHSSPDAPKASAMTLAEFGEAVRKTSEAVR